MKTLMKRFWRPAGLALALLTVTLFLSGVFAQGAITLSIDSNIPAQAGQEVIVPVKLSDGTNTGTAAFTVTFDPTVLTFVKGEKGPDVPAQIIALVSANQPPGQQDLALLSIPIPGIPSPPILPAGKNVLWNLTFRVAANAAGKTTTVGLRNPNFLDLQGRTAPAPNLVNGSVAVAGANAAPVLAAIADQTVTAGQTRTVNISATDADGDAVTFTVTGTASGFITVSNVTKTGNTTTAVLTIAPAANQAAGNFTATVTANDGKGGTDSKNFNVTVQAVQQNNPPVLAAIADQTVTAGQTRTVNISATDADGDAVTFTVTGTASGFITVSNVTKTGNTTTATLTIAPGANQAAGDFTATVTANDGKGGTDSKSFRVTVAGANVAPVLAAIADQSVAQGETRNVGISATDANGDAVTFAVSGAGAAFTTVRNTSTSGNTTTATLVIAPPANQAPGDYQTTVTASDGRGGSDSKSFKITVVRSANAAPTITIVPPGDKTVEFGKTLTFQVVGRDDDVGDVVVVQQQTTLANSNFTAPPGNPSTGIFNFTPDASQSGKSFTVTFGVTDGKISTPVTASVRITVTLPATPTVSAGTATAAVGGKVTVPIFLTNGTGVAGASFTLNFDASILQADTVVAGDVIGNVTFSSSKGAGFVTVLVASTTGTLPLPTFNAAAGNIAVITFNVVGRGASALSFAANRALADANGNVIANATFVNGSVTGVPVTIGAPRGTGDFELKIFPGQTGAKTSVFLNEGSLVSAVDFTLNFDNRVIELTSVGLGSLVDSAAFDINATSTALANASGALRVLIIPKGTPTVIPTLRTGAGSVIDLTFNVKSNLTAPGSSNVTLTNVALSDRTGNTIAGGALTVENGRFLISTRTLTVANVAVLAGATGVLVPISIDEGNNVSGAQFTVSFDRSLLLKSVTVGSQAGNVGLAQAIDVNAANASGSFTVLLASLGAPPLPSFRSGSGVILNLTFDALGAAGSISNISLSGASLSDVNGNSLPVLTANGAVRVAKSSLTVGSRVQVPGGQVTLPVTINEGNGIAGVQFVLQFDTRVLSTTTADIKLGAGVDPARFQLQPISATALAQGQIPILIFPSGAAASFKAGANSVIDVTFTVAGNAKPGTVTSVIFASLSVADTSGNSLPANPVNGSVRVNTAPQIQVDRTSVSRKSTDADTTITATGTDVDGDPLTFTLVGGVTGFIEMTASGNVATITIKKNTRFIGAFNPVIAVSDQFNGSANQTIQITVTDADKPVVKINTPIATTGIIVPANQAAVPISGTVFEEGTGVANVSITASDGTTTTAPVVITTIGGTAPNFTFSGTINVSSLRDGQITFRAVATDNAGNASDAATATASKDTTPPVVTINTPISTITPANQAAVAISGRITEVANGVAEVSVTATDGATTTTPVVITSIGGAAPNFTFSATVNVSSLRDGTITFRAVAKDGVGNTSAAGTAEALLDRTGPALTIQAPVSGTVLKSGVAFTVRWSQATDPSTVTSIRVEVSTDGGATFSVVPGGDNLPGSATNVNFTPAPGFNSTTVRFRITATDGVGNRQSFVSDQVAIRGPQITSDANTAVVIRVIVLDGSNVTDRPPIVAGVSGRTIKVTSALIGGQGTFDVGGQILLNGTAIRTRNGSSVRGKTTTELRLDFSQGNDLDRFLAQPGTVTVQVRNSDGALSNTVSFEVVAPTITKITPDRVRAGSDAIDLVIDGRNFREGVSVIVGPEVIRADRVQRNSATQIVVRVKASLLEQRGTLDVRVANPASATVPGAGQIFSNTVKLTVE